MNPAERERALQNRRAQTERGGIVLKLSILLGLLVFVCALYFLRDPLLGAAGRFWVGDEQPLRADAIVVLAGDNEYADRASRAAELYHAGWAPRVVASGRILRPYASEAEFMGRDLVERGVPRGAVVRFPQSARNTREEAQVLRELFEARHWQRILVVTSNYHTRRARYIFRRVLPPLLEVHVIAAADRDYDPNRWWRSRQSAKLFLTESVGFVVAMWELRDRGAGSSKHAAESPHGEAHSPVGAPCSTGLVARVPGSNL